MKKVMEELLAVSFLASLATGYVFVLTKVSFWVAVFMGFFFFFIGFTEEAGQEEVEDDQ